MSRLHVFIGAGLFCLAATVQVHPSAAGSEARAGSARPAGQAAAACAAHQPIVAEFGRRVLAYAELHRRVSATVPPVQVSRDPAEIRRAVDALGDAIRAARPTARQGEVFSPEVVPLFRRWIREECGGNFRALLAIVHDETPPLPRPAVNGCWPGESMTVMPVNLLCSLPALPEGLEYRLVNRDLVLWDNRADLIVDILSDVVPPGTQSRQWPAPPHPRHHGLFHH